MPLADPPELLLTLPVAMVKTWNDADNALSIPTLVSHDPPGGYLGSGGATISALHAAWKTQSDGQAWTSWLASRRRIVLHGGGQSRRLPAYAAVGKPLLPVPVLRWSRGQRLDQTLLEVQLPEYLRILNAAPSAARVMLASGDVLLQLGSNLPRIPEADVVGLGVLLPPEEACDFGVFFIPRGASETIGFFLQKPDADRIRELAGTHSALADSGVWLLSERAVEVLRRKTGGDSESGRSREWSPRAYELYAGFGLALGAHPVEPDPDISRLSLSLIHI